MDLKLFDFQLEKSNIALSPVSPRDNSKLLVLDENESIGNAHFYDLPSFLNPGDTLVVNETKVIPSYFECFKKRSDEISRIKLNLVKEVGNGCWLILAKPKKRIKINDKIIFSAVDSVEAKVVAFEEDDHIKISFNIEKDKLLKWIYVNGTVPLPPYITSQRDIDKKDEKSYQTVYAKTQGSFAAPTAGLHFTEELLKKIKSKGVNVCTVLLHVGSGTFSPIKTNNIKNHKIHSEWCCLDGNSVKILNQTKANKNKIIAVGTTSMRILETAINKDGLFSEYIGETNIYITPGFKFNAVDMLVTNFHLPKSSLFVLVCAFYGIKNMQNAYKYAIKNDYRFYSYGDACLIKKNYDL